MKAFNIDWVIDFEEVYELFDRMDDKQAAEELGLSEKDYIKLFKEDRDSLIYEKYRKRQGELEQLVGLPNEVELPAEITTDEEATEWLSTEYGYFINGYELDTDYILDKSVNLEIGQYAAIKINGKFTVQVKREAEGYVIDILSENERADDVINSVTVWNEEIESYEEI